MNNNWQEKIARIETAIELRKRKIDRLKERDIELTRLRERSRISVFEAMSDMEVARLREVAPRLMEVK